MQAQTMRQNVQKVPLRPQFSQ